MGNYPRTVSCRCETLWVSCRVGNYPQTVSCRHETQRRHIEWETIRKQFPVGMKHKGVMSSGKPFASSFLSVRNTMVPCRVGNYSQIVSCRYETQRRHIEWETIRKQFPVGMKHKGIMSDRKPFANSFPSVRSAMAPRRSCHFEHSEAESRNLPAKSFLSVRNTLVSSRIGNHSRTVSCR